ncbi:hypothetical protein DM02DRAFT_618847 [Periconia macrospinosa]|uniref:Mitochondrial import inner membrane translocase subunit TIM50 n=1 Tax=Periconia macrospinosa TaxID=97972 RepID=A0A2V1D7X2_9PLEO|nr:hypothetical protein DM02DRAFT_618847 [Periconia macrospinosa]
MNVLAQIGTPPPSPPRSRAPSASNIFQAAARPTGAQPLNDAGSGLIAPSDTTATRRMDARSYPQVDAPTSDYDEKTPLLHDSQPAPSKSRMFPQRVSGFLVGSITFVLSPVVAVGHYVIACFRNDQGNFSIFAPVYHMARPFSRTRRKKTKRNAQAMLAGADSEISEKSKGRRRLSIAQSKGRNRRSPSVTSIASTSTAVSSDSELDSERPPTRDSDRDTPSRHTRSKSNASSSTTEEIAPARRQIRIRLHNEESLRQRKSAKKTTSRQGSKAGSTQVSPEAAAALKSPTGPMSSKQLTKFPRAPQPPRPLVPRRQPSYSASGVSAVGPHQKTLILDLDETLIHSMAKGGRFTTGHMVEVKLQHPVGAGGQIIGPQVPILYYVHKRPYCDEFLKKVMMCARLCKDCVANIGRCRFVSGIT